jgi:RNA polymerase sigma-70 factor (ECF subfamily)
MKSDLLSKSEYRAFLKGNRRIFAKLYREYCGLIYGIAIRYTVNTHDAQDVLQDTFLKMYEKRDTFDNRYPIGPWLRQIAVNEALMLLRKKKRLIFQNALELEIEKHSNIEVELDLSEMKLKLIKLLHKLPDGYRTVFNLYVIENLTHKEICDHLGISEATSRSQLHKAKKLITKILNKEV